MVDKENQWDDIEYTGDEAEYEEADAQEEYSDEEYETEEYEEGDDEYSEEYEDDEEYEEGEEYDDEEYEDDDEEEGRKRSSAVPIIAILIIILLLAGAGYFAYAKFFNNNSGSIAKTPNKSASESIQIETERREIPQNNSVPQQQPPQEGNTQDMGDFFFNEAGGSEADMMSVDFNENGQTNISQVQTGEKLPEEGNNDIVATVTEQPETSANELAPEDILSEGGFNENEENADNAILVTYNKETRSNPFKPPVTEKNDELDGVNETGFEIIEPPSTSIQDENLKKLLQTQISGILYDEVSPSAIVNLNGVDQFVKIGDKVSGYVIEDIRKDKVQISYKNNSYVASVGELFTRGLLEKQPAVANFESKFAGRHRENN